MKNYNLAIGTAILTFGLIPSVGKASPSKYTQCPSLKIKEAKNSTGYFFSEDCQSVYVLPPKLGLLRVSEFNHSIDPYKTCRSIDAIEETRLNYDTMNASLSKRADRYAKKIDEIDQMLEEGLLPVGMSEDDLYVEQDEIMEKNLEIKKRSSEFDRLLVTDLEHYAQREGARGHFILESLFTELLQEYKDLNSDLPVQFVRMPLDQSYLAIVDKTANSEQDKIEMPALLELIVPGLSEPIRPLSTIGMTLAEGEPAPSASQNIIFGDALSGKIRFTALGACALNRALKQGTDFSVKDVRSEVSANVFYQYQVAVKRHHSLTFKMDELIRKIHKQSKKGGLFSRKTLNKMIDDRRTSSWIQFHVESEDTRFEYTDDYIKEVKKEFLARALAQIVAAKTGDPSAQLTLIDPSGKTGSDVISDSLEKCSHLYCKIGGAAFKVLGSIFNSRSAVSDLTQKFKGEFNEIVLEKKKVEQVGSMTFE